jgi:hypothetical protein
MQTINGVSYSFESYSRYSEKAAIEAAMDYKRGKDRLQTAIAVAVYQLLAHGNANLLTKVFSAACLTEYKHGASVTNADGKIVYRYITQRLFDGREIVKWDKDARRFRMAEGWTLNAEGLDRERIANDLRFVRWDQHEASKSETAFDLDKAILRLIKKASDPNNGGFSVDQINDAVKRVHRQILEGQIRKAS